MNAILLDLLAFGSVLSGILVITSRNPIISVLFLIAVFVNVACYLILLGINFIGLAYLIVYVGAIAILFLFVVMMLNIKLVELQDSTENSSNPYPLAFVLGTLFVSGLSLTNPNISKIDLPTIFDSINLLSFKSDKLETLFVSHSNWDSVFVSLDQINSLGQVLYTSHALFLIIGSMILLLAMVGPIILSHKPTKRLD
ncbi:NADH dehydrogenase subunit 6 [Dichotomocladium elegans]|nr:NADH dehydrogenase subunit 6 [Dichotomocladium elegans]KAI9309856.1 NADH dehydrogenase subunit 6 [Dichotomocladium elegans]KAI9309858.1 NADH dehydrogenase subunit 6 [Dichotomocladium elegans]